MLQQNSCVKKDSVKNPYSPHFRGFLFDELQRDPWTKDHCADLTQLCLVQAKGIHYACSTTTQQYKPKHYESRDDWDTHSKGLSWSEPITKFALIKTQEFHLYQCCSQYKLGNFSKISEFNCRDRNRISTYGIRQLTGSYFLVLWDICCKGNERDSRRRGGTNKQKLTRQTHNKRLICMGLICTSD